MHIIVVRVGTITHPMTQSSIRMMLKLGHKVSVCTTKNQIDLNDLFHQQVEIHEIDEDYTKPTGILGKFFRMFSIRKKLWKEIDALYADDTVLWVGHNITIKHLGDKLSRYRYILHLNELNENIAYWPQFPFIRMNASKIGNSALAVIVPEYNRAHITKIFWNLKSVPFVMPNKPYLEKEFKKKPKISHSEQARELICRLEGKKIVLYQGVISKERRLDTFVQAVKELGDQYAFIIMGPKKKDIPFVLPDNCYLLDYIYAPYHLEITGHADIGILSYIPEKTSNSPLNSIYCAPNKIFEYSMFGIPMISNDVPAMKYLFDTEHCGEIADIDSVDKIKSIITNIDQRYDDYSENAMNFYVKTDNLQLLSKVLKIVEEKMHKGDKQ